MNNMRILHIASHEINVGDGALNAAIRQRFLANHQEIKFELSDVAVHRKELTAQDLDQLDLVIVGGGGAISNSCFAARTGLPMPLSFEAYEATRTPFAFIGVGHNIFAGQRLRHAVALRQTLELVQAKGDLFSVRNDGSRVRLIRDIGPAAEFVTEIPDPGFFVDASTRRPPETGCRPFALIQVAGDAINDRLQPGRLAQLIGKLKIKDPKTLLVEEIAKTALHLWQVHGLDILLAPHIQHDVPLCSDIMQRLYSLAGRKALHRPFRVGGMPHPSHSREFFGAYRTARLIVGMRGHAVICGIGLRRPTIALSSHPKVAEFLTSCDLSAWSVPMSELSSGLLTQRCDSLLDDDTAYFAARDTATARFDQVFDDFVAETLGLVACRAPSAVQARQRFLTVN